MFSGVRSETKTSEGAAFRGAAHFDERVAVSLWRRQRPRASAATDATAECTVTGNTITVPQPRTGSDAFTGAHTSAHTSTDSDTSTDTRTRTKPDPSHRTPGHAIPGADGCGGQR